MSDRAERASIPTVLLPRAPDPGPAAGRGRSAARVALGLAASLRPRQWVKNVLVLAAPLAAGALGRAGPLDRSLETLGLFCLVAGGTYLWNDSLDVQADRLHPTKRHRPVASGTVGIGTARAAGSVALAVGIGLAWLVAGYPLALVVGIYVAVTLGYSTVLKGEAVLDLAAVAAGFVLRAIAGGVAAHVPLSDWFLIVASFGSLFMVAGKRHAEHEDLGEDRGAHRATLQEYSLRYLAHVRSVSSAVTIAAYCLWAFERAHQVPSGALWFELSIIPFVVAMLRYALLVDRGQGGAPEDVVLGDHRLQVLGALWAAMFALGVYA
ncbi:MAG: decaprenyl-phosphate phosphoribosyltransferase [Acidimicrobiales bacterium]